MTEVRGDTVTLRPIQAAEFDALWSARRRLESFARPDLEAWREDADSLRGRIERSGEFAGGEILFGLEADGRLIGEVQGRQPRDGLPPGVFELGIEIYEERDRGRGLGGEAVTLITSHLFEREGAIRVQASTDVDNAPMRRVLDRLGFAFEGVLRGYMPSTEGPRDYAMYAMTAEDWTTKRNRWTRTS